MNDAEKGDQHALIQQIAGKLTLDERRQLADWVNNLVKIRGGNDGALIKSKNAIATTMNFGVTWPIVKLIAIEVKRHAWDDRGLKGRSGISFATAGLVLFGSHGAGIAALGGAIGVPLWLVIGAGGTFLAMLYEEFVGPNSPFTSSKEKADSHAPATEYVIDVDSREAPPSFSRPRTSIIVESVEIKSNSAHRGAAFSILEDVNSTNKSPFQRGEGASDPSASGSTDFNGWSFVSSRALVSMMGKDACKADSWWRLISSEISISDQAHGVLVKVTPRNEYQPLLHIIFDIDSAPIDYNPNGLSQSNFQLLVPQAVKKRVTLHIRETEYEASRTKEHEAQKQCAANEWEAGRAEREASFAKNEQRRLMLVQPYVESAHKFRVPIEHLLNVDLSPTWICQFLARHINDDKFDSSELDRLTKVKYDYFAAAIYWREWERQHNPWLAIKSCSLLRRADCPQKALHLSYKLAESTLDSRTRAALYTTRGGAQRDLGDMDAAEKSANAARVSFDQSPHPYLLLGAICYQQDRRIEGDKHFQKAYERGATEKDIDYLKFDAERRR